MKDFICKTFILAALGLHCYAQAFCCGAWASLLWLVGSGRTGSVVWSKGLVVVCGVLGPQPEAEPASPAWKADS